MLEDASATWGHAWLVAGIYRPFKKDPNPLAPTTKAHTHRQPSQSLQRAGGRFGSQCKYIFSLSKTHFPTTVKKREGYDGGGRARGRAPPTHTPPPPLSLFLVHCCLLGLSNIWHCLSPGLLVQAGRGTHSANLMSRAAGSTDQPDLLQSETCSCL